MVGTAIGVGASLIGGSMAAKGAKSAANTQAASAQQGIDAEQAGLEENLKFQREALAQEKDMYDQSVQLGQPYRNAGERALQQYTDLLYGRTQTAAPKREDFLKTPAGGASGTGTSATAPQYDQAAFDAAKAAYSPLPTQIFTNDYYKLSSADQAKYTAIKGQWGATGAYGLNSGIQQAAPKLEDFKLAPTAATTGTTSTTTTPQYDDAAYQTALDSWNASQTPEAQDLEKQRISAMIKMPGYDFQMDEGTKALERSASARSGLLGGAQTKAISRFGQGLASTSFNSFMDRLAGLSGQGASAAGAAGNAAMQAGSQQAGTLANAGNAVSASAGNVGSLLSQQGAANASGYLGASSALNSGFNNAAGTLAQSNFGSSMFQPGGTFGGSLTNGYTGQSAQSSFGNINWYA